jgi:hypothetical protein
MTYSRDTTTMSVRALMRPTLPIRPNGGASLAHGPRRSTLVYQQSRGALKPEEASL